MMRITNNEIFARTNNGWEIYKRYINHEIRPNKAFASPLREDKHPSFSIFLSKKQNRYIFIDHARDDVKGNAIRFVELKFKLDYHAALDKIAHDFNIKGYDSNDNFRPSASFSLLNQESTDDTTMQTKDFSNEEFEYFAQYGISEEILKKYEVYSAESIVIKGRKTLATPAEPIFVYHFSWGGKIYQPNSSLRFMYYGDKPENYVFGYEQLPFSDDTLIITGGEKDVLTFASLGYSAICYNSETYLPDKTQIYTLKNRFRNVIACLDVDKTGKQAAINLSKERGLPILSLPLSGSKTDKDICDFIKNGNNPAILDQMLKECIIKKFDELIKMVKPHMFDMGKKIEKPDPVLSIKGQTILSVGNLMTIGGLVKTGKSSVIYSLLAASLLKDNSGIDTFGLKVKPNPDQKAVLHFDTEQSNYDFQNRLFKAMQKAGLKIKPDYFDSVHLLEFSYPMRIKIIQDMIAKYYYNHGGLHLVVVDGVADLINSVNEEDKSNQVVDMFHRMAVLYNCPIILIVHLNPDGNKTRGHLGSQLDRKSESLILIKKEGDASVISPKYCRNANVDEIPLMQFRWDSELQTHVSVGYKSKEEKEEIRQNEILDAIEEIFNDGISVFPKGRLAVILMQKLNIGRSTAYKYISELIEKEILLEEIINNKSSNISMA